MRCWNAWGNCLGLLWKIYLITQRKLFRVSRYWMARDGLLIRKWMSFSRSCPSKWKMLFYPSNLKVSDLGFEDVDAAWLQMRWVLERLSRWEYDMSSCILQLLLFCAWVLGDILVRMHSFHRQQNATVWQASGALIWKVCSSNWTTVIIFVLNIKTLIEIWINLPI